jgi:DNA polymerase-3 subunit delta'
MFFKNIIGQDPLKRQLIDSAKSGIVPHAQLICGQAGSGTYPLALAYARYLNCSDRSETDACGKCPSCLKYNGLVHPDLHFIFPMISNNKGRKKQICDDYMPEWREFLSAHTYFDLNMWLQRMNAENQQALIYAKESDDILHKVSMKIYEATYRVLIIWLPERMHLTCANKLLKIIEEPPMNTVILMVSEEPAKILGTILSRSQRLNVSPIGPDALAAAIESQFGVEKANALEFAHLSHGDYLQAVDTINRSDENEFFLNQFIRIMRNSWTRNVKEMKNLAEEMAAIGRERQKNFLAYCQRLIRENFMYRFQAQEMNYMSREEGAFSVRFAAFINERNVFDMISELSDAERHIAQNGSVKMIFFDLSIRIAVLLKR